MGQIVMNQHNMKYNSFSLNLILIIGEKMNAESLKMVQLCSKKIILNMKSYESKSFHEKTKNNKENFYETDLS